MKLGRDMHGDPMQVAARWQGHRSGGRRSGGGAVLQLEVTLKPSSKTPGLVETTYNTSKWCILSATSVAYEYM